MLRDKFARLRRKRIRQLACAKSASPRADPPPIFRLGSTVTAELSNYQNSILRVPASAVLTRNGESFVWVVDLPSSTVSLHKIDLAQDEAGIRVSGGLAAGARIVTAGIVAWSRDKKSASNRNPLHEAVQPFQLGTQTSFAGLVFHAGLHGGGTLLIPAAGAEEDPAFTIKTMVIQARWPGASAGR